MALHPDFPESPYAVLDPAIRWFPADEALRETSMEKLMPPLVPKLRKNVKEWRNAGYPGASDTSRSLLNWWFNIPHLLPRPDGTMSEFQYYFAQQEALETIIYLYDTAGVYDKYDLMRFDSSGSVSTGMFDESWRRFVIKMATGTGKSYVLYGIAAIMLAEGQVDSVLVLCPSTTIETGLLGKFRQLARLTPSTAARRTHRSR